MTQFSQPRARLHRRRMALLQMLAMIVMAGFVLAMVMLSSVLWVYG